LPDLRAAAGAALVDITTTEVAGTTGPSAGAKFHHPLTIGCTCPPV